jgi:ABC-type multidrug transport system fused ATPase/permease subunit
MELIDMSLPNQAINTYLGRYNLVFKYPLVPELTELIGLSNCCVQLVILCIMGKYLTITVPALGVILFFVQRYYLRTSRQVRLLDIEAKSPLFAHFVETMQGITVIRAMKWKMPFQERLEDALNRSQKPFYMLFCIQQWLQLVLDCVVMALAVILVSLVVSLKGQFSAGSIGVALNLILSFNTDLMILIKSWTMLETSIGAVSRVQSFVKDTPSEIQPEGTMADLPPQWPAFGEVIFQNTMARYRYGSPWVTLYNHTHTDPNDKQP